MKKYKNAYTVCIAVTLMFFALFTARLINWQLIGGDGYRELASLSGAAEEKSEPARGQTSLSGAAEEKSEPARGQIYDKNGKGLIVNQTRYRVVVQNNSADSSGLDKTISALTELMKKMISHSKSDITAPVKLYRAAEDYCCTNITINGITYLATELMGKGQIKTENKTIPVDVKQVENHAENYIREDEFYEQFLSVFYNEV